MPRGEAIILEYNFDGLNGIDFDKGCYVGQELMARSHFAGIIRKRCVPFQVLKGGVSVEDEVQVEGGGKAIGKVRAVNGEWGIAVVRIGEYFSQKKEGVLLVGDRKGVVKANIPEWWPESWTRVEG
eukprot:TRINITY_DN2208_c0_g2_i4.p6 TRINITY_DN2208_c0_g2~~TRINITY_DN2208_c0_g2_i4.p6  ORF type:complete len:126 (+),score=21.71 TRINITY_DN2208_c0_g2_i4:1005-1382(+)